MRRKLKFLFSKDKEFLKSLKKLLGTYPSDVAYYKSAFTHRSAMHKNESSSVQNNERLEYLGDAILGAIVAEYLYKKFPFHEEGDLTKMRSTLVNRNTLLKLGKEMHLEKFLIAQINIETEGKYILCNMIEALVGAIYLDLGYSHTKHFVLNILLKDLLKSDIKNLDYDFKSKILEWGQKNKQIVSFVSDCAVNTHNHTLFTSDILIEGNVAGSGTGESKKAAEQDAAKNVWTKWEDSFRNMLPVE